jgi:hypothetical protein
MATGELLYGAMGSWGILTAQVVHPVNPVPPHCWYLLAVHDELLAAVTVAYAATEVVVLEE